MKTMSETFKTDRIVHIMTASRTRPIRRYYTLIHKKHGLFYKDPEP